MVELGKADRRLHVGDLQIEAEMRVRVLVVVAVGQVAELPVEAALAGVVVARLAIAVAAPVAEGFHRPLERRVPGEGRAAFAHGDVVGGIEAERADIAERADVAAVEGGAERVAAVLDQEQVVALGDLGQARRVEGIAERVGDHDRPRLRE